MATHYYGFDNQLTRNDIKNFDNIYYCAIDAGAQLWHNSNAIDLGYNAGIYGHNWRAFKIVCQSTVVLVGYRNFIGKHISRQELNNLLANA